MIFQDTEQVRARAGRAANNNVNLFEMLSSTVVPAQWMQQK